MAEVEDQPGTDLPLPEVEVSSTAANGIPRTVVSDAPASETEAYIKVAFEAIRDGDFDTLQQWGLKLIQSTEFWIDVSLIAVSFGVARFLFFLFQNGRLPTIRRLLESIPSKRKLRPFRLTLLFVTWITLLIVNIAGIPCPLLRTYSLILTWFVFINLPSKFINWKSWMSVISTCAFVVIVLHVLGILDDSAAFLDRYSLSVGEVDISALDLIKGLVACVLLFWLAGLISKLISHRVSSVQDLEPNVKVLFTKGIRIGLFILAILLTMGVMGIKITTLAVFSGALGLGLGFGLQKVVSNLVSGIILLLDKSIKPGDVIEIGGTYGWINTLNLRYASVITRDNKEHLVPNEDFITNPVINWSFSSKLVRIRAPFGISYTSDVRLAMELAESCAKSSVRVVESPAPRCNLMGFGDSSVDLELRFWIEDPHNGVGRVQSEVLLKVWDAFHENGIEFPFPQRDVHIKFTNKEIMLEEIRKDSDKA